MKILFYKWQAYNEDIIEYNLGKMGHDIFPYDKECVNYTKDLKLASDMIPFIHTNGIDAVFSTNYFPIISSICDVVGIPYYSWVFDSPHFTLFSKQSLLSCNHIAVFDKELANSLREKGCNTVYHVPLSVDSERFQKTIKAANPVQRNKYSTDIAFIGTLYTNEFHYFDTLNVDTSVRKKTDDYISSLLFNYDKQSDHLPSELSDAWLTAMGESGLSLDEAEFFSSDLEILYSSVIEKHATVKERQILLSAIGERYTPDRFGLYTNSDLSSLPKIKNHNRGIADYDTQMPLIFNGNRINLNITLRSIHSGIPLRVLDIMGCAGFVLSNYQPELAEFFKENEEIVLFRSLEECLDKIDYYLSHENKRAQIAQAGYEAVRKNFDYKTGLTKLLSL